MKFEAWLVSYLPPSPILVGALFALLVVKLDSVLIWIRFMSSEDGNEVFPSL